LLNEMLILAAAALQAPTPRPPAAPTLVVVITVDQMRADYLDRWRDQLTGGLARLLRQGAVFTDAYQDHAMTETAPGHATVLSGRNPHSTGIVSNEEGVSDTTAQGVLVDLGGHGASPWRFRGTALFDWMAARYPDARALSVSRKDRGAILPIGRARQQVYWYESGEFTTSRYYSDTLPGWVDDFNQGLINYFASPHTWNLLRPARDYPEPDDESYEYGGRNTVFPHVLPAGPSAAFLVVGTPFMDSLTLALALDGVNHLRLGRGPSPDLLSISLSTTDAIGHGWGPDSREMHDQMLRVDRYLGQFLDSLYVLRDSQQVIVALTADHGVTSYVQWSRAHGDRAAREVNINTLLSQTEVSLVARAGPGTWMRWYGLGMLLMDRRRLEANHVNVDGVVSDLAARIRAVPGVLRVDTPRSLAAADTAQDPIARRWLNAIPPDMGVELVVTLEPHDIWGPARNAEHGQPSDDDAHVPLILVGPGVRPGSYANRVQIADLAPTLARLLGVRPLERLDGRPLTEALAR
jgi:predicted AlkP superfamily pyrophosphatase or phosphodiesterase